MDAIFTSKKKMGEFHGKQPETIQRRVGKGKVVEFKSPCGRRFYAMSQDLRDYLNANYTPSIEKDKR